MADRERDCPGMAMCGKMPSHVLFVDGADKHCVQKFKYLKMTK
jgi:hypothetical protein